MLLLFGRAIRIATCLASFFLVSGVCHSQTFLDKIFIGKHKFTKQEPFQPHAHYDKQFPPATMVQLGNLIDILEEGIRDDGTVVLQHPSVWGQARMTLYRKNFETEMVKDLKEFNVVLSARVARSDQASFENLTALSNSLSANGNRPSLFKTAATTSGASVDIVAPSFVDKESTLKILNSAFQQLDANRGGKLGVEPTVYLDEKKRYLEHLNEIRRINLGDDTADSAGYGMFLVRMPASILPGEKTREGFGAQVQVNVYPDFGPDFLPSTYRNLVINDLIDQLTPVLYYILISNLDKDYKATLDQQAEQNKTIAEKIQVQENELINNIAIANQAIEKAKNDYEKSRELLKKLENEKQMLTDDPRFKNKPALISKLAQFGKIDMLVDGKFDENHDLLHGFSDVQKQESKKLLNDAGTKDLIFRIQKVDNQLADASKLQTSSVSAKERAELAVSSAKKQLDLAIANRETHELSLRAFAQADATRKQEALQRQMSRGARIRSSAVNGQSYPIAPADMVEVFGSKRIYYLSTRIRDLLSDQDPIQAVEIRNALRRELEVAYDVMARGMNGYIPLTDSNQSQQIVSLVRERNFSQLGNEFVTFMNRPEFQGRLKESHGFPALCWAIAIDAALLNDALREDVQRWMQMGQIKGPPVESLLFYLPASMNGTPPFEAASDVFRQYVAARWPIIAFAVDPVVDQQNIADAYSMRRELRMALAFSFASGKINFDQFNRFQRRLEQESETIALNRTVVSYSHGNDTFGWRFAPRFQNPPPEPSNLHALGNLVLRNGPPRDYGLKHSRIEPGQRELTAVLLMPSFLNRIRVDSAGNWFRLTNPDDAHVSTGRMLEQGRRVKELKETCGVINVENYRPEDLKRLYSRLLQVEKMLPMQTSLVGVPYENSLGGFELFGQGHTALVPKLIGFEGIDEFDSQDRWVFLYAKNVSIHETKVVVGGKLPSSECKDGNENGCPPAVEILSREVVRVKLPGDAKISKLSNGNFVEVYLATPNGISNKLLIPAKKADKAPPPTLFSLNDVSKVVKARLCCVECKQESCGFRYDVSPPTPTPIILDWRGPAGLTPGLPPSTILVKIAVKTDRCGITVALPSVCIADGKIDPNTCRAPVEVTGGALLVNSSEAVKRIIAELYGQGCYKPGEAIPAKLTATITVEPMPGSAHAILTDATTVAGSLALELDVYCPGERK